MASNFFDTNVVIYAVTRDPERADRAEDLLRVGGTISTQVLNETVRVLRRKFRADWPTVDAISRYVRNLCLVEALTEETHVRALEIAQRVDVQIHDANIIAAALLAGCDVLCTEDMHDGLVIDGLTLRNPFA